MKLYRVITILFVVLLLASSVSAFDGYRKGFVLGGGLGVAPYGSWSAEVTLENFFSVQTDKEDYAGVGLNIIVGYAWDEQNMIVWEGNSMGAKSDFFYDGQVTQGFSGAAWYHYFGPQGKSFFTVVGLGSYFFDVEDIDQNEIGGGYLIGAGYEFARHFQAAAYLSGGKTKWDFWFLNIDFAHNHVGLLVSAIAF